MLPSSYREMIVRCGIQPEDRLLVAVSGGVDSVVAAALTNELGFTAAIAHANFRLRGQESDSDEDFVRKLAASLSVPFHSRQFNTKNYADEKGISIQMAARDLRYQWLRELMIRDSYQYLVTGHHLDDAFETALFNFIKGTGIAGLRGMLPLQEGIFRPLLFSTREHILAYAKDQKLSWREDSSNDETKYSRNFLRHEVIPKLHKINPSLASTFRNTRQRLRDTELLLEREAERRRLEYGSVDRGHVYIHRDAFADHNIAIAEKLLTPYSLSFSQVNDLLDCIANKEHSRLFYAGGYVLNLDREHLIISPQEGNSPRLVMEKKEQEIRHALGTIRVFIGPAGSPVYREAFSASLDFDMLSDHLVVRKWRQGDRFRPLGMTGKKKVSDFMIDEKIPLNLKKQTYVLESDGDIAWVIGHRISHDFRVTESTRKRLNIILDHDQSV